jgi:hypothetical protein
VFFGGLRPGLGDADPAGWMRAAAPAIAVMTALALRDAYQGREPRTTRHVIVDATIAVIGAILALRLVALLHPELTVSGWPLLAGSVASFAVLFFLRRMFREPGFRIPAASDGRLTKDDLVRDAQAFERRIRQRNHAEVVAGLVVVAGFAAFFWRTPDPLFRLGHGLVIAGTLFIIYRIRTRAQFDPIPLDFATAASIAAYRRQLERQRDLLRTVTSWYLLPLLPGMAALTVAQALVRERPGGAFRVFALFVVVAVLTRQLNLRVAGKVQDKIDRLAAARVEE